MDSNIIVEVLGIAVTAGATYLAAMAGVRKTIQATQYMNQAVAQGHKNRLIVVIQGELKDFEEYLRNHPQLGLPALDVFDTAALEDTVADQTRLFASAELLTECHALRINVKKLNVLLGIGKVRHVHHQDDLTDTAKSHWAGTCENCQRSITKIKPLLAAEYSGPPPA